MMSFPARSELSPGTYEGNAGFSCLPTFPSLLLNSFLLSLNILYPLHYCSDSKANRLRFSCTLTIRWV